MRYSIAAFLIIFIWFLAGSFIVETKNAAVFGLNQILLWPRLLVAGLISPAIDDKTIQELILENKNLRAQVFQLKQSLSDADPKKFIAAKIHAVHPLNKDGSFSINVGSSQGARLGMAVTVGGNLLIGRVIKVFTGYSLVKTIFSPDLELPVRIGESGVEALLSGGAEPRINFIIENNMVNKGDIVFAASPDFPFGINIGELGEISREASAEIFHSAPLIIPYRLNNLVDVWLQK